MPFSCQLNGIDVGNYSAAAIRRAVGAVACRCEAKRRSLRSGLINRYPITHGTRMLVSLCFA
jgi:hypothetical protein